MANLVGISRCGHGEYDPVVEREFMPTIQKLQGQLELAQLDLRIAYECAWSEEVESWHGWLLCDYQIESVEVDGEWRERRDGWSDAEKELYDNLISAFSAESSFSGNAVGRRIDAVRAERAALWKVLNQ